MGCCPNRFSGGCSSGVIPKGDPDPSRWNLLDWSYSGRFLLLFVNYPDCTNYSGNKILLFENVKVDQLLESKLDPHFLENGISPIARFAPTQDGLDMANKIMREF